MDNQRKNKVTIIGAGFVGSTSAYTLMMSGLVSEMVIIDINSKKAYGEVMDLNHGMSFVPPVEIYTGDYSDSKDSDIIIITAGANQKKGETRIDLVHRNTDVFKDIISKITKYNSDTILLVVTNPVDILTYITYKLSGFSKNKVIGSGTVLDTARFRYLLGEHVNIDTRNVHGYIIGEHGDTEVAAWSLTNIAGMPMEKYCRMCRKCDGIQCRKEIFENVRSAAYKIINAKGATYYAVALAVKRIVEAILRDENSLLTVSSYLDGEYGIQGISLSVPTIVNKQGISRIIEIPINHEEQKQLIHSANTLKEIALQLNI